MSYVLHYECTICHETYLPDPNLYTCPKCGEIGILDIIYDYNKMKKSVTLDYFDQNKDFSMWRYLPMMSLEKTVHTKTLHVGWTPLYKSNQLNTILGVKDLYIKDEGMNPTQSLKDRASAVAVLKAIEVGQNTICCSSTGNAASSLAGNAARLGLKTVIFIPKRAPLGKLVQLLAFGASVVRVDGDYKAAFSLSKKAINHYGYYNRNAAINPHLVEGKKTVALEIAEQLKFKPTDWVAVSVGDGCTIAGVYKGFYDLVMLGMIRRIPKILGVQSKGCAPFYEAFKEGRELLETEENTIADSIAVGIPRNPIKANNAVRHSKGTWIAVTDEAILRSIKLLGRTEGIFGEPAGVTALAGVEKALKQGIIKQTDSVTIIVTGNGLKDTANAMKSFPEPILLQPNLEDLIQYMTLKEDEVDL